MGPFDKNLKREAFDSFKVELQEELNGIRATLTSLRSSHEQSIAALRVDLAAKTSESEAQVHESASKARASLDKLNEHVVAVEEELSDVEETKNQLSELLSAARQRHESIESIADRLEDLERSGESSIAKLKTNTEESERKAQQLNSMSDALTSQLKKAESLPSTLAEIADRHEKATQDYKNIQALLAHAMKRKSDIDVLHAEVIGQDLKSEDGKIEHIDGMRDSLSRTYDEIRGKVNSLRSDLDQLTEDIQKEHQSNLESLRQQFQDLISNSNEKVTNVSKELTSLLPGALAEGLSAAFENKKNDETTSLRAFEVSFGKTIKAMICIALIPFFVDVYLLVAKGQELVEVIKETPKLIAAILPLYLPVLWLAYSTNKKINLAKRLIEEYTHKAVLGKTFSGLAKQIEDLPSGSSMREELRAKLLLNLLDVSAENPGKLISDYNKADHPLMDALENSSKLSKSVEALSKIPGMASIVRVIESHAEKVASAQAASITDGLANQAIFEGRPVEGNGADGSASRN